MPPRSAGVRERQKRTREDNKTSGQLHKRQKVLPATATHLADDTSAEPFSQEDVDRENLTNHGPLAAYSSSSVTEAASLRNELKEHVSRCQLIVRNVGSLVQQRESSTAAMATLPSLCNISPREVVRLNVGGEIFTVPLQLLLKKDGGDTYFDMLFRYGAAGGEDSPYPTSFQPPLLDDTGALFIDRDPGTFRFILNYLRGSRMLSMLSEDRLSMLKTDAQYFQLHGLIKELSDESKETGIKFNPGPGVNLERNKFRVVYSIATIGENFLITGCHRITFEILNSEYVGIGLISDMCVMSDQEFHKTLHCCVYYMTGVFYSNFPHHRKEDRLEALDKGDFVSLMVDMNKRVAEYTLKGSVKTIPLGNARKLRFAVVMKMNSRIRIVPEEEARKLPLFRRRLYSSDVDSVDNALSLADERDGFTQLSQNSGAGAVELPTAMTLFSQLQQQQHQRQLPPPQGAVQDSGGPNAVDPSLPFLDDGNGGTVRPLTLDFTAEDIFPVDVDETEAFHHRSAPQEGE